MEMPTIFGHHCDYIGDILKVVPPSRFNPVALIELADREHPVSLNFLEEVSYDLQAVIRTGVTNAMFSISGAHSWGLRVNMLLNFVDVTSA